VFCVVAFVLAIFAAAVSSRLSNELAALRSEVPQCRLNSPEAAGMLKSALGLGKPLDERLERLEMLTRLASRESNGGLGGYGGYGGDYRSYGGGGLGRGGYGDSGYGSRGAAAHDRFGEDAFGEDLDDFAGAGYGGYASAFGGKFGGAYGPSFSASGAPGARGASKKDTRDTKERERDREKAQLAALPTTQSLSCRSPRCDRNATTCAKDGVRSLATPYGCCSDYMLLMLVDVCDWLDQQSIPYFVTYGTLLGALREDDILTYTQDLDIVVDRSHWPRLQKGLEAADFFGGRKYSFGVDQWEERVSRVCADWEGFAATTIGGPDNDRLSRAAEFHLDVYASDWWQITELHLVDCVEPIGSVTVPIRGRNFSAPARPRACLEKLYGAEWRIPKKGLSGVN